MIFYKCFILVPRQNGCRVTKAHQGLLQTIRTQITIIYFFTCCFWVISISRLLFWNNICNSKKNKFEQGLKFTSLCICSHWRGFFFFCPSDWLRARHRLTLTELYHNHIIFFEVGMNFTVSVLNRTLVIKILKNNNKKAAITNNMPHEILKQWLIIP